MIYSTRTAFQVGFVVSVMTTGIGAVLGAFSGFYQARFIDGLFSWIASCIDAIPFYLLVAAISFLLPDTNLAMYVAMIGAMWTGTYRVVRSQVARLRAMEFIEATKALGASAPRTIFKHILPNTLPILLVETSLGFVTAVKTEAILSFLGLGVKDGMSWGLMLFEASSEVTAGYFSNFLAASSWMFLLVMAFSQLSDALQDALVPRSRGAT